MRRVYWIATVKFIDGTVLHSDKFYEYDTGIKIWSAKFSAFASSIVESISYTKYN